VQAVKKLDFDAIQQRWKAITDSRRGRRVLKGARITFFVGIMAYLVWELRDVDPVQVIRGLPLNPLFYALLLVGYFILPASQILAYSVTWNFRLRQGIPAFIKKRILNKDVLGYSGEVYLFAWASEHVDASPVALMKTIRDQNILSAAASTLVAIVLVALFIVTGQITLTTLLGDTRQSVVVAGGIALLVILIVMVRIWKYLFDMPWRPASKVFSVHMARVLLRQVADIGMWHLAMPEVSLKVWFTYAAVSIIVTRIPFLPAADLVVMGIALGLADVMQVPEAQLFALFAAVAVLNRGLNLLFFATLVSSGRASVDVSPPKSKEI